MINQTHKEEIQKINVQVSIPKKPANIRMIILKKNIPGKINDKFLIQFMINKNKKKSAK